MASSAYSSCHGGARTVTWSRDEVAELRERLGVNHATFAQIVGVDTRTAFRWESGAAQPTGTAAAVMTGLREKLRTDPSHADQTVKFVVDAAALGGLAYIVLRLLDAGVPRVERKTAFERVIVTGGSAVGADVAAETADET